MSSSTAALPGEPGPGRGRARGPGASATATATATLRATIERACAHATSARPARSEAHPAGGSAPPQPAATPVHPALMDRLARTLEGLEGVHDRLSDLSPDPPAPVRWLEDDDELAGRLQRLLTRQAQARGIDLS